MLRLVAALAGSSIALSAAGQQARFLPLHTINTGGQDGEDDGSGVSGAGDVNNDGFDDVIIGIPDNIHNAVRSGSALVVSGLTGEEILFLHGNRSGEEFGAAVGDAGDVNNDGFDDVIVGAPRNSVRGTGAGRAVVLSGANGEVLWEFFAADDNDLFGTSVDGAGDVNNDGFDDVIVGAFREGFGTARVYSGASGLVLHSFSGDGPLSGFFGRSVSGAGDVNNDGFDDVIVGEHQDGTAGSRAGRAVVYSGANGQVLHEFFGNDSNDEFGWSVGGAGDVDGDGFDDVIIGAYSDNDAGSRAGGAFVYSGQTGGLLFSFLGGGSGYRLGHSVSGVGDVNGDGMDDVIVGQPFADPPSVSVAGSAILLSGADGTVLDEFFGAQSFSFFGVSVRGAGDINSDGLGDFAVKSNYGGADGASYTIIYVSELCDLADVNCDGQCTPADFNAWILAFNTQSPGCNQNVDGVCTPADFNAWILNYAACVN